MRLTCAGCPQIFEWHPAEPGQTAPTYHNRTCQKRASKKRNKIRDNGGDPFESTLTCGECRIKFTWAPNPETCAFSQPLYCSSLCRNRAKVRRKGGRVKCPRPYKRVYETEDDAWDAILTGYHIDEHTLRPYNCTCGEIHIGHPKYGQPQELTPEEKSARLVAIERLRIPH